MVKDRWFKNFSLLSSSTFYIILSFFFFNNQFLFSQTTGKLSGQVTDTDGEPLIGTNIELEGTGQGAATDKDGFYIILNVRAGTYNMRIFYIGYQTKIIENVIVNADKTTRINIELASEAITGEEVIVTASQPLVEFNQTSAISTIVKDDIEALPVQDLTEIVNLQAGVVDGHFRGGRLGEVQYQVDGVSVNNPYDNLSTLQLDRSVLEEVQVISGTFDAKYGQAMSGVVNSVLRSGSNKFEWSGEVYLGDYYTSDETRYPNNNSYNPSTIQNYQLTLSGPIPKVNTTFLLSSRRFVDDGYLFGERRFVPTDTNNFEIPEFKPGGDGATVPMKVKEEWSGQFKIANRSISKVQLSYQAILLDVERSDYKHGFRLNPDGTNALQTFSISHGFDWAHTLSEKMFYRLNLRQNYYSYNDYKYKDVEDNRYQRAGAPQGEANYEFGAFVQGVDLTRFEQKTNSGIAKIDLTWQVNRANLIETGVEIQSSEVSFGSPGFLKVVGPRVLIPVSGTEPEEPKVETYYPKQLAAFAQDRFEWSDLVLRAGLRLDLFDANATIPSDLQNPANAISGAPQSHQQKTTLKSSLSPRLGFNFPLSSTIALYFSYGHFYQMPGLRELYSNSNNLVLDELQEGGINFGVMGNPDLKPELTIQYEFGLKQALTKNIGLELTLFYKDIRDLLGVEFVSTYAAADYARFTNVDFGSIAGFTIKFDQRPIGPFRTTLDYTLQFADGNSSDPKETANRAEAGKDPRPRIISFNWDQRHTLNATGIFSKSGNYTLSAILRLGSGQPYTPAFGSGFNADLETNSGRKPSFVLLDFRGEKFLSIGKINTSLYLKIINLLNTHFVNGFVFNNTGSPDYSQFPEVEAAALIDPSRFHEPRRIEFGFTIHGK
jgi:outer membrane receptor protein involved in Fe transport